VTVTRETIASRVGDLVLENGYPTPETASLLYDTMDLHRATQAYIWALPTVGFKTNYDACAKTLGTKNGDVLLYRDLADKVGMLTPNVTTLYAFGFWDMAVQGPLVVDVPAGLTAGGVMDLWQQPLCDMGQTGPDKGEGGRYLIVPPGHAPIEAPGHHVFASPSNQVWFATRGLDPDPVKAETKVKEHRLYGWHDRADPPVSQYHDVAGRSWASAQPNSLDYWRLLAELYANEPVAPRDRMMFGMLKPLGLEPGKPFAPDARAAKILTEAAVLGDLMARTSAYAKRDATAIVYPGKRWEYSVRFDLGQENPEQTMVQFDARGAWFYLAIGMSTGMQGRIPGFGQVYLETARDKAGNWLDGGKTYRFHVDPDPPVRQFWSITLYDNITRGLLVTPQGAADTSSRRADLVTNADGSVDVFMGPVKPAGATNWIQTLPGKGWFPLFRFYAATEAYFDKSWQLNDIEEIAA
jgi:hypothetical protein